MPLSDEPTFVITAITTEVLPFCHLLDFCRFLFIFVDAANHFGVCEKRKKAVVNLY